MLRSKSPSIKSIRVVVELKELKAQIQKLFDKDVIRTSAPRGGTPVLFVKNKESPNEYIDSGMTIL